MEPSTTQETPPEKVRKHPLVAWLLIVVPVVSLVIGATSWILSRQNDAQRRQNEEWRTLTAKQQEEIRRLQKPPAEQSSRAAPPPQSPAISQQSSGDNSPNVVATQAIFNNQSTTTIWNVNLNVNIDAQRLLEGIQSGNGWLQDRLFNQHPTRQAIADIGGKKVVVIPVRKSGETRVTDNITFDTAWRTNTKVRVYVANVPTGKDPRAMKFQQKRDVPFGEDPSIGPVVAHGDLIDLNPGSSRYFADRGDTVYEGAYIVLLEDGLTIEQVNGLQGLSIR